MTIVMTSSTSRRAFLAGSAIAAGSLLMAGRLVFGTSPRTESTLDVKQGRNYETAGETVAPYLLDLPRPPVSTG